jgi:hypothetical protein
MDSYRRSLVSAAALAPLGVFAQGTTGNPNAMPPLVLSDFNTGEGLEGLSASWRGFTDRVMGGISDADFVTTSLDGRSCIRLTGRVTTANGGGFAQMALDLAPRGRAFDASAYRGIEITVYGNNEDYNVHLRTADARWYDQSYRATILVKPEWQVIRLPWEDFAPNGMDKPLDASRLQRIGLLGWMREFEADIALSRIALYP